MDAEFEARKAALLAECRVDRQVFEGVLPRLEAFMEPFVDSLVRREQVEHAVMFVRGLLSDLDHQNVESIAYRFGEARLPLQWFIGTSDWDDEPLRDQLVREVAAELGDPDGVLVFDPSAFPKSGRQSVGVARQWCGRLGKVENCQVAVYLGYVSRHDQVLVDERLYLPKEWTDDKARCRQAGVPKSRQRHLTRHALCLQMLRQRGPQLPHAWVAGDDELGRPYAFRWDLHELHERYLLAVPSNTLIRDLESDEPPYSGHGRPPQRPWQRVDHWREALPDSAWTRLEVRDGAKGPLTVEIVKRRVVARAPKRQAGHDEVLVVIRYKDRDDQRVVKTDYYLSNAATNTPLAEFARVAKAEHRIEECLQRAKSEAGLADYEVRHWIGWHHHQTLSLIATWFLVKEARRGKKMDPSDHRSADPRRHLLDPSPRLPVRHARSLGVRARTTPPTQRTRSTPPLEKT
ncbi:MAG TPA: IS701 family transposase [Planctomycetaceae bacterium]|nr:IS701 family transposase [Planctomycetaceae bacterium]